MIDINNLTHIKVLGTSKALRELVLQRGWKAYVPYPTSSTLTIDMGMKKQTTVYSSTPETTSFVTAKIIENKYSLYKLLEGTPIKQLRTIRIDGSDDVNEARELLHNGPVVVKPIDGAHGKGITVGVSGVKALQDAISFAAQHTLTSRGVIVQQQYQAQGIHDIRIICIDGSYTAALERVNARVFGDGVHTVGELIDLENKSARRGQAYVAQLAIIDIVEAQKFLGKKYDAIPGLNEQVRVLGVANYGAGGETIDVTDDIPYEMRRMAEDACKQVNIKVAGVDFLVAHSPKECQEYGELDPILIEMNATPSLYMHDYPTVGKNRHVVEQFLDYLTEIC